ncbi:lipopolysaccharide biosynthesis protein [Streptomyces sp. BPTC-684]|uniref:lipopolysaccharide biosynthesis protein n=1 Tax=Streptomyces sp. BPTC-684 TaxID=3043734 RepID=UPI0024B10A60|nr:lipopolysaccharide biosynthesis protein [Streptomyces sp. BPTC-684]WHM38406.1 lipopolysaccharide biosynthesis protein [Streptomyces sp. BPTC-684]
MSDTTSDARRAVDGGEGPVAAGSTGAPGGPQDAPPTAGDGGGDSMFRNAYALMLSTAVSASLGLGFWLVAARYYSEEAVGQGSAAIAAMRLLASITATTMIGAVVRYVPRAGRATGPLVVRAYVVSTVVVAVASTGFLFTLPLWGASYEPLGGLASGAVFVLASVAWAVLTLQDGVLTGLRKAVWVPVGNAVFSLGKLLLLAGFAAFTLGVFLSWAAAMVLSILPLGWLIFRRLIPAQAAADRDRPVPQMREIGRFLAGDSVGALFSLAMINLLPVMVAVRFDAAQNGFFYIAYTVGGTMEFMAINMASSLTAHASHSPDRLADGVRGALRRMALLLVPVVLLLIVFARQILAPFGADYAEHGTLVLRLLAAAALPRVAVELYIGVLRVQGRTGVLALLQGAMCTLVLGSAAVLLGTAGIEGAGWAVLVSMCGMALVSAPGLRAALAGRATVRTPRRPRKRGPEEYGTSWARDAALARAEEAKGYGTRWTTQTAYLSGGLETGTPALGIPVYVPGGAAGSGPGGATATTLHLRTVRPGEPEPDDESLLTVVLWLLLGLAAGLFWVPLSRAEDARNAASDHVDGTGLISALPPVSLTAGVLLIVVCSAAVSLYRARPALLAAGLGVTVAALHTAPLILGVKPDPLAGPWHGALTRMLAEVGGLGSPAGAERSLPIALQVLCLALVALTLIALGTHWRLTSVVVWVLAVAGWAWQSAFAQAAMPVFAGLCLAAGAALLRRAA